MQILEGSRSGLAQVCCCLEGGSPVTALQVRGNRLAAANAAGLVAAFVQQQELTDGAWAVDSSVTVDGVVTSLSTDAGVTEAVVGTTAATIW